MQVPKYKQNWCIGLHSTLPGAGKSCSEYQIQIQNTSTKHKYIGNTRKKNQIQKCKLQNTHRNGALAYNSGQRQKLLRTKILQSLSRTGELGRGGSIIKTEEKTSALKSF